MARPSPPVDFVSLLAAGLFSLSVYTYAASVTVAGPTLPKVPFRQHLRQRAKEKSYRGQHRLNLGNREIIIPALQSGEIDIVPEYLGALLNFYNGKTEATSQQDVSAELAQVLPADFTLLNPALAT